MRKIITYVSMICLGAVLPASAGVLYSNGPLNANTDAFTFNFGFAVSDSFTLSSPGTITGFTFVVWNSPGETVTTVDWSIGSASLGSELGSGTASTSNFLEFSNSFGYDINTSTVSGLNVSLGPGTYWLTLQNAVTTQEGPAYWDENDGPSQAFQANGNGEILSETFDIIGADASVPEPGSMGLFGVGLVAMVGILRRKTVKA